VAVMGKVGSSQNQPQEYHPHRTFTAGVLTSLANFFVPSSITGKPSWLYGGT